MRIFTSPPSYWRDRFLAGAIHSVLSAVVAALSAILVFFIWYPYPYRELSGGSNLFILIVAVDLVIGPLITFAVFDRRKSRKELGRDLTLVGALQMAALAYGLWTVSMARPVHLVFEIDRFRVVHAVDVPQEILGTTPPGVIALPWSGPTMVGLRPFKDEAEKADATMTALRGVQLGFRPDLWQTYAESVTDVLNTSKPTPQLIARFPDRRSAIKEVLAQAGRTTDNTAYLPLVGRKEFWTAFIDPVTAEIVAVFPLDSF